MEVPTINSNLSKDFDVNNFSVPAAVQVRRANKSYDGKTPILNNLNMTVPRGSIYSLLGSSGCGKTTVLSCIVGTLKLDSGDVFVFGNKPGSPGSGIPGPEVGFMPQGVTLYSQLSIMETLQYFGRIYGMTDAQIDIRMKFLTTFLDLPCIDRQISSLSGGQQRRISLAVCLLHEPPLLILDEPTVGVDPLIRESIWDHLAEIVRKRSTTVIITTHYIEETRQSNTVGLMRNGRLLTEKSPTLLLKEHDSTLLEKIILTLCMKDESLSSPHSVDKNHYNPESDFKFSEEKFKDHKVNDEPVVCLSYRQNYQDEEDTNVSHVATSFRENHKDKLRNWYLKCKAVFIRNFLILFRNPMLMYMAFFCPMFHIVVTSAIIGKLPKHINFGVVDPEINNNFSLCSQHAEACNLKHLSCGYLDILFESMISPVFMNSVEEALESVEKGDLVGYMAFPQNYSEQILNRFLEGRFALEDSFDQSTITFRMDMSNYFTGFLLQQGFLYSYQDHVRNFVKVCNQTEDAYKVELPLNYRKPVYGEQDGSYSQGISIAVLVLLSYFLPGCTSSYTMIVDRMQGTLDRTLVAGSSITSVILPYYLTEGFLIVVQTILSSTATILIFDLTIQGSMVDFIATLLLTGISGLTMGIFIAQVVRDLYESITTFIFLFVTHLFYIGVIWPMDGNHYIVRMISKCFPLTHVTEAMRSIVARGWTTTQVWPSYGLLIATTLIFFALSVKFWRVR